MFESSRWVTHPFQAFLTDAKTITWMETWSECSICHSQGLSSFKNMIWLPAVLVNRIPPGSPELQKKHADVTLMNKLSNKKEIKKDNHHSSAQVLTAQLSHLAARLSKEITLWILHCAVSRRWYLFRLFLVPTKKIIKSKTSFMSSPKVCTSNYHPYLLRRCTAALAGTDERQRQERSLWSAHILPSCICKSCPISITVEFVLSYEWFLRFIQIRHCRKSLVGVFVIRLLYRLNVDFSKTS